MDGKTQPTEKSGKMCDWTELAVQGRRQQDLSVTSKWYFYDGPL
jgi:hypothetical protein